MSLFLAIFALLSLTQCSNWFGTDALDENGDVIPSCHMTPAYPPPSNRSLESFVINLDLPAADRWTEVTTKYKTGIQNVVDLTIGAPFMLPFREMVDKAGVNTLLARLPSDWGDEIVSIASIVGRSKTDVFLYNLAYSLMGFCTCYVYILYI